MTSAYLEQGLKYLNRKFRRCEWTGERKGWSEPRYGWVVRVWEDVEVHCEVEYDDGTRDTWWNDYLLSPNNFNELVEWL